MSIYRSVGNPCADPLTTRAQFRRQPIFPLVLLLMEKNDVLRPYYHYTYGTNSIMWAHQMRNCLIGRKLWRIVMGDITQPIKNMPKKDVTNSDTSKLIENDAGQNPMEDDAKFIERLEDWNSKNHQIITWLDNTSILAIHTQFDAFDTASYTISIYWFCLLLSVTYHHC